MLYWRPMRQFSSFWEPGASSKPALGEGKGPDSGAVPRDSVRADSPGPDSGAGRVLGSGRGAFPRLGAIPRNGKDSRVKPSDAYAVGLGIQFLVLAAQLVPYADGFLVLTGVLLLFGMLLRHRLPIAPRFMAIDCLLFCAVSFAVPELRLYLFVFVYYFAWHGKLVYALVPIVIGLIDSEPARLVLPLQALLSGYLLYLWRKESAALVEEIDGTRQKLYRMEQTQNMLLMDYQDAERLSQLVERRKLAEKLHDNLGHELTAAHLSVKSAGVLLRSGQTEKALLAQEKSEQRIHGALLQLKAAVGRLDPGEDAGLGPLTELFDRFVYPVQLTQRGDYAGIQAYQRQLLYSVAKEALTNIAKHSVPSSVSATLEFTDRIIRFSIQNNGVRQSSPDRWRNGPGNGLRYIRRRLEAIRGSLNTDSKGNQFSLVVTIPREYREQ